MNLVRFPPCLKIASQLKPKSKILTGKFLLTRPKITDYIVGD